jgi:hypothetical protein
MTDTAKQVIKDIAISLALFAVISTMTITALELGLDYLFDSF